MANGKKIYKSMDELPLFLKLADLADILQVSEPKAREIVYTEGFPLLNRQLTGKRIVIPKLAFIKWAEQNMIFENKEAQ